MVLNNTLWEELLYGLQSETWVQTAMGHVAQGLSEMMQKPIYNDQPHVLRMPLSEVPLPIGSPRAEMVGVYLEIESGLRGWTLLILPVNLALNLTDVVMGQPSGTSVELGEVERSALAEVGNLTLTYFLNAVAELTGQCEDLLPSPPGVIVDMLGAILDLLVIPAAEFGDELTILETTFQNKTQTIEIRFWVMPDLSRSQRY